MSRTGTSDHLLLFDFFLDFAAVCASEDPGDGEKYPNMKYMLSLQT